VEHDEVIPEIAPDPAIGQCGHDQAMSHFGYHCQIQEYWLVHSSPWFVRWQDIRSLEKRHYGVEIRASHSARVPWWVRCRKDGYVLGIGHKDVGMSADDVLSEISNYRSQIGGSQAKKE
jgi:hypothetical protein